MAAVPHETRVAPSELDAVAARAIGTRWIDAFNRRDGDALVQLADASIGVYPTRLPGDRGPYWGHDGVRRWMSDLSGADAPQTVRLDDTRFEASGEILVLGQVVFHGRPLCPYALLLSLHDGSVSDAHAYLSGEDDLKSVGRISG